MKRKDGVGGGGERERRALEPLLRGGIYRGKITLLFGTRAN